MQGENAWVFVNEECIAASVKAYYDFEKKLLEKYPREKRKEMKPTAISGKPPNCQICTSICFWADPSLLDFFVVAATSRAALPGCLPNQRLRHDT